MSLIPFAGAVQKFNRQRDTQYQIERSLRFNSADSAYLNWTPASAGNRKTWTWSGWVKRSTLGGSPRLFYVRDAGGDNQGGLYFNNDTLKYFCRTSGTGRGELNTVAVFRDPSSWYHIMGVLDAANTTFKIYVNGVEQTLSVGTSIANVDHAINATVLHAIGREPNETAYFPGYMTEVHFIDGSALDPTSFGEYNEDTGVWQPKAYTGSYGTNGFYLNFSDNSTVDALGTDFSGNDNTWSDNNFSVTAGAGNDSLVDTPTNYGEDTGVGGEVRGNYATLNPLTGGSSTTANGNLDATIAPINGARVSTIAVTSGKWYCEMVPTSIAGYFVIGIGAPYSKGWNSTQESNAKCIVYVSSLGVVEKAGSWTFSSSTVNTTYTTNNVIGVALDMDANTLAFYKDGVSVGSATINTGGDPVSFLIGNSSGSSNGAGYANFGQRPFAYTAPSGFKALCTQNLPEPTIVDGGEYFNTVLYTGNGSTQSITGVGFQPDFVWVKERSSTSDNLVQDAVRGVTKHLETNSTSAEQTASNLITSFDSDGFGLGVSNAMNENTQTYVAWNWKANGSGVSNTAGTITSTVSANTDSGFSIVTYTGTGANATVGHGLGVAPKMVIVKKRSGTSSWPVYHVGLTSASYYVLLESTSAEVSNNIYWQGTAPTSSVFSIGTTSNTNENTSTYVAYCFAAIPGYSAFGSYTGNGSADGPFVYTGFRPAFVLVKISSASTENWWIHDTARSPSNLFTAALAPNDTGAEQTGSPYDMDILSNGFKLRNSHPVQNSSGATYIYMAFAENPFKYSLAR